MNAAMRYPRSSVLMSTRNTLSTVIASRMMACQRRKAERFQKPTSIKPLP